MGCWCSVYRSRAQRPFGAVRGRRPQRPCPAHIWARQQREGRSFSLVRCPAAPRLHTRTGKPKEACLLEQAS